MLFEVFVLTRATPLLGTCGARIGQISIVALWMLGLVLPVLKAERLSLRPRQRPSTCPRSHVVARLNSLTQDPSFVVELSVELFMF